MAHFTTESVQSRIAYLQWVLEVLENHCEIQDSDSEDVIIFKLYAKIQNVELTWKEFKNSYNKTRFKSSKEISQFIPKANIDDKDLEQFVKRLQKNGKDFIEKSKN